MSRCRLDSREGAADRSLPVRARSTTTGLTIGVAQFVAIICVVIVMAPPMCAWAASPSTCRFYIASQHDYDQKVGFYLDLKGPDVAELTLALSVGDGKQWRRAESKPRFAAGREYEIRAVVAPDRAQLFVDGKLAAESVGEWEPMLGQLDINFRPPFTPQGEWLAMVRTISAIVSRAGADVRRLDSDFSATFMRPLPLQLFEPGDRRLDDLPVMAGETVTIRAAVRFETATLKQYAPFIDAYGQCRYGDWPEKIRSDDDLKRDIALEDAELAKMPLSTDYDQYGGYLTAGWRQPATGFFGVVQRDSYWWFISPEGNPCFYLGVSEIPAMKGPSTPVTGREFLFEWLPPREQPWERAWGGGDPASISFYACNLIRKYGPDYAGQITERAVRRVRAWGFGGGKWGAPAGLVSAPVLGRGNTPSLVQHPDVFDPQVCEVFRRALEGQIAPSRDDPRILGWSLGNEWAEIIAPTEVNAILAKSAEVPAKRALIDYGVDELYGGEVAKAAAAWRVVAANRDALYASSPRCPEADVEKLRQFYADRYYDFVYRTIKSIDPNHLYFGFWIMPQWGQWWPNEADWGLIARHCDVIGYDRYAFEYDVPQWRQREAQTGKPTLCGEYGFPAWYEGMRGFGRYGTWARDDAEAGELYARWVRAAATDPYSVGQIFFVYRDQPITGRGPGRGPGLSFGENFAFGLITETDKPKWELVRRAREANLNAARWRLEASRKQ
jgi:hypothetical protein